MLRHMRLSVRGALQREPRALEHQYAGSIIDDDGKALTDGVEIWNFFADQLSIGREYLPLGKCDGFDYKTGCPGHDANDAGRGG